MKKRIAVCPRDVRHDTFITVVHATEDWVVDRDGDFVRLADNPDQQIVHGPSEDNDWVCTVCGSCADFVDTEDFETKGREDTRVLAAIICDHCSHSRSHDTEAGPCRDCTSSGKPSNFKPR